MNGEVNIDSDEGMNFAVQWQTNLMNNMRQGATWGIPEFQLSTRSIQKIRLQCEKSQMRRSTESSLKWGGLYGKSIKVFKSVV